MRKIVINGTYGGFCLSEDMLTYLREKLPMTEFDTFTCPLKRDDAVLVEAVETLSTAVKDVGDLVIVEIPDDVEWCIQEYDGDEWVAEKHRTWR